MKSIPSLVHIRSLRDTNEGEEGGSYQSLYPARPRPLSEWRVTRSEVLIFNHQSKQHGYFWNPRLNGL